MTFYRKSGGGNVAPTIIRRRQGGVWANVQTIKRRSGGTWVTVWSAYTPVSASVSPTSVSKSGSGTSAQTVTSATVTASGSGGNGSYTYAWEYVSGNTFTLNNPSGAATWFSKSLSVNTSATGVYRCKVSDGTSIAYTSNVTITLDNPKPV